jgi:hypothetical protein
VLLAVVLSGGGVVVAVLMLGAGHGASPGASPMAGNHPAPAAPAPGPLAPGPGAVAGEPPIPPRPNGAASLTNPVITTAKQPYRTPGDWCSLLNAQDISSSSGYAQLGTPDSMLLCTHHLADRAGFIFVSDIPAASGAPYSVRGNTAILFQNDPTSCEVSVVLNQAGGVLDIDLRGVTNPRVPPCQTAVDLAGRVFDRLPSG